MVFILLVGVGVIVGLFIGTATKKQSPWSEGVTLESNASGFGSSLAAKGNVLVIGADDATFVHRDGAFDYACPVGGQVAYDNDFILVGSPPSSLVSLCSQSTVLWTIEGQHVALDDDRALVAQQDDVIALNINGTETQRLDLKNVTAIAMANNLAAAVISEEVVMYRYEDYWLEAYRIPIDPPAFNTSVDLSSEGSLVVAAGGKVHAFETDGWSWSYIDPPPTKATVVAVAGDVVVVGDGKKATIYYDKWQHHVEFQHDSPVVAVAATPNKVFVASAGAVYTYNLDEDSSSSSSSKKNSRRGIVAAILVVSLVCSCLAFCCLGFRYSRRRHRPKKGETSGIQLVSIAISDALVLPTTTTTTTTPGPRLNTPLAVRVTGGPTVAIPADQASDGNNTISSF